MNREEIRALYDREYAASYDEKCFASEPTRAETAFELKLIEALLKPEGSWLDSACRTGFFLSQFPTARRIGADPSPAMLEFARAANPGCEFEERDLRDPNPAWNGQWDLVTCSG